jgi:pSer/pThr/pTyr-binding forkhead associated (FHA) protein
MATLYQIREDGSQAERWELTGNPLIVGRSSQAEARVKDENLSRRHFLIEHKGEDYVIRDLNSRNGTWLRGQRVTAEPLRHNDLIVAGRTRFRFAAPAYLAAVPAPQIGPHGTLLLHAAA